MRSPNQLLFPHTDGGRGVGWDADEEGDEERGVPHLMAFERSPALDRVML